MVWDIQISSSDANQDRSDEDCIRLHPVKNLKRFVQIVEPGIRIPVGCDDGLVLHTEPHLLQVGFTGAAKRLSDEQVNFPSTGPRGMPVQPMPNFVTREVFPDRLAMPHQIVKNAFADDVRMHVETMVVKTCAACFVDDLVERRGHGPSLTRYHYLLLGGGSALN